MPEYRKKIIRYLKTHVDNPPKKKELAKKLGVKNKDYPVFRRVVNAMTHEGILSRQKGGRFTIGGARRELQGKVDVTRKGFGFVAVEGMEDIFVSAKNLGGAARGDIVVVQLLGGRFGGANREGRISKVIERSRSSLVGIIGHTNFGYVLDVEHLLGQRTVHLFGDTLTKDIIGAMAVADVTDWGSGMGPVKARLDEVIGTPGDPKNDFRMTLAQFEMKAEFPADVEDEVRLLAANTDISPGPYRKDLRDLTIITIDPADAKDFDDAISLEHIDGRWQLGVHIADVSAYVQPGTATDAEAFQRGNSTYFTEGVVPMLPHLLSSDLCSLKPDVDRPAFSAIITLTDEGQVEEVTFHRSLINSSRRFTYGDVHDLLEDTHHEWYDFFFELRTLTDRLYKHRVAHGSVDFDIPKPLFTLDDHGIPRMIHPSERLDSHRMVEECMLLANRLVAERIPEAKPRKPFLYRVHPEPGTEKIATLSALLKHLHLPGLPDREVTSSGVRDLLLAMEDSPYRDLIENVTLRSMAKAIYSSGNVGHFGLAFPFYSHFTSPIRRYADLAVHRMMVEHLVNPNSQRPLIDEADLVRIASQCTAREQVSLQAERAYQRLKELRFLATQIGNEFEGIISGVVGRGIFVQIKEFLVDGFIGTQWIDDDDYTYIESQFALQGRRFGRVFQLGQEVHIKVRDVSIERRFADFLLVEDK